MSFNTGMPRMNPDAYLIQYAAQNNLSIENAKTELESTYGVPNQNDESIFPQGTLNPPPAFMNNANDPSSFIFDNNNLSDLDSQSSFKGLKDLFKKLGEKFQGGSRQEGDPNPTGENQGSLIDGPKQEGDPNPTGENYFSFSENSTSNLKDNPENYARYYAHLHNISLEEAIEELKEKYGDPQK